MATAATSGPTAPVPKDPQPSVDRIDGLASRILTGDILLPKFQRSFVWERPQIVSLLDSVARGYPIGSVLLWQSRQELRSENRIADLEIALPEARLPGQLPPRWSAAAFDDLWRDALAWLRSEKPVEPRL